MCNSTGFPSKGQKLIPRCLAWGKTNKHKGFKVLSPHAAVQSRNSWVVFVEAFVTDDSTEKSVGVEVDDLGRRRRREAVAERHRLPLEPEQVWDKIVYGLNIFVREPFWAWKNGTAGTKAEVLFYFICKLWTPISRQRMFCCIWSRTTSFQKLPRCLPF